MCEVVAFYFHPAFMIVLGRGLGLIKVVLSSLEVEMCGLASRIDVTSQMGS